MKMGKFREITADVLHNQYPLCSDHFDRAQFMNDRKERLVHEATPKN